MCARSLWLLVGAAALAGALAATDNNKRPHIVLIVADDLGWNDVGFHGMNHVPTPNLDALAAAGVVLQRHYVTPLCTPSRAALLTGRHPTHTGMQHGVIYGQEPRGLPLSEKLLPQYLRELGYRTHLVGKWHLGSYKKDYLPLSRGFDSHVGFWTGKIDMFDHTNAEQGSWGFDFRRGYTTAHDLFGKYATDVYTDEAIQVINRHNQTVPLFLMVAHSAVHTGNPSDPIRAPPSVIDAFRRIDDPRRQRFAGVLSKLDESVGLVVQALARRGLLERALVLFTTDNGGAPDGFNENGGSNYPLRGTKNTPWEGGVRGAALLWSPLLQNRSRTMEENMHLVDWLPTLYSVAGGDASKLEKADGRDMWTLLSLGAENALGGKRVDESAAAVGVGSSWGGERADSAAGAGSARVGERADSAAGAGQRALLLTLDPVDSVAGLLRGDWKLVKGTTYKGQWDGWYGPAGREVAYNVTHTLTSVAARAIQHLTPLPKTAALLALRAASTVVCNDSKPEIKCSPLMAPCLFNVRDDPCERRNLANERPEILQELLRELSVWNATAVPPNNQPLDPAGDPARWGRVYTHFRDYAHTHLACTAT